MRRALSTVARATAFAVCLYFTVSFWLFVAIGAATLLGDITAALGGVD